MICGQDLCTWRRWFAWRPARLSNGKWAWLVCVDRWRDGWMGARWYRYDPPGTADEYMALMARHSQKD